MKSLRFIRWFIHTKRHPSAILLIVQLAGMLLYPFIEHTTASQIGFKFFGLIVLGLTIKMVRQTPGLLRVSLVLGVPIVLLLAWQIAFDAAYLLPWSSGLEAIFYFYAAACLIAYMMQDYKATLDEILASAATFTLLAWGFTHLFVMIQAIDPGTFTAAVNPSEPRTWTELNYLSFALLSSTGIGDVIPLTPHARAVASIEMFVGVMYLAGVVARLIGFSVVYRKR